MLLPQSVSFLLISWNEYKYLVYYLNSFKKMQDVVINIYECLDHNCCFSPVNSLWVSWAISISNRLLILWSLLLISYTSDVISFLSFERIAIIVCFSTTQNSESIQKCDEKIGFVRCKKNSFFGYASRKKRLSIQLK